MSLLTWLLANIAAYPECLSLVGNVQSEALKRCAFLIGCIIHFLFVITDLTDSHDPL